MFFECRCSLKVAVGWVDRTRTRDESCVAGQLLKMMLLGVGIVRGGNPYAQVPLNTCTSCPLSRIGG